MARQTRLQGQKQVPQPLRAPARRRALFRTHPTAPWPRRPNAANHLHLNRVHERPSRRLWHRQGRVFPVQEPERAQHLRLERNLSGAVPAVSLYAVAGAEPEWGLCDGAPGEPAPLTLTGSKEVTAAWGEDRWAGQERESGLGSRSCARGLCLPLQASGCLSVHRDWEAWAAWQRAALEARPTSLPQYGKGSAVRPWDGAEAQRIVSALSRKQPGRGEQIPPAAPGFPR